MIVHVINLDRKTDRMERMRLVLNGLGLAFERVAGIDGRQLPDAELDRWSTRNADGRRILSAGEIGCLLSHREAWRRIAAIGTPGIVVEDDIHLALPAAELFATSDWLPAGTDLVKIETTGKPVQLDRARQAIAAGLWVARLRSAHLGTAGYIATPAAARRLLDATECCDRALDHLIFDPASPLFESLVIAQMIPALCMQDQFMPKETRLGLDGEIERAWAINKAKRSVAQKLTREIMRLRQQAEFHWRGSPLNPSSDRRTLRVALAPVTSPPLASPPVGSESIEKP